MVPVSRTCRPLRITRSVSWHRRVRSSPSALQMRMAWRFSLHVSATRTEDRSRTSSWEWPPSGHSLLRAIPRSASAALEARMNDVRAIRVLAISGSLRRASSNTALVNAAARLAPSGIEVAIYEDLDQLPPFNPDLDNDTPPTPVCEFRAALRSADAVLVSSPEYAHGVPGVLKNALDWVVGS